MAEPEYRPPAHAIPSDNLGTVHWIVDKNVLKFERKRIRRELTIIILLIATICLLAGPTFRMLKNWRGRSMAAESLQLLAQGKNEAALLKARTAYWIGGPQTLTFRALAMGFDGQNQHGQAFDVWTQLLSLGTASIDDRYAMVESAIRSGHLDEAEVELSKLPGYATRDLAAARLVIQIKLARGQKAEALAEARSLAGLHPEDGPAQLLLSRILALQGDDESE